MIVRVSAWMIIGFLPGKCSFIGFCRLEAATMLSQPCEKETCVESLVATWET